MATDETDWEARWRAGQTGWDQGASPPVLIDLVETGRLPRGRALVPGCGAGYDVLTLSANGEREVVGTEISSTALSRFETLRERLGVGADRARVVLADFFAFAPESPFDLIWDYTFLCAVPPARRPEWAAKVASLLAPDGVLATLIFPVRADVRPTLDDPGEGPPYPMHPDHVRELVAPHRFREVLLEPVAQSHPSRQGMEWIGLWKRGA